jgi:2-iminobutanoate/2-iminopropanoate deaminase
MKKEALNSASAPTAVGPYSQAVISGDFLFCSGQIPIDPATGQKIEGDAAAQATRALQNIAVLLEAHGIGFADVVKTTMFLTDLADFKSVNEVYARHFSEPYPARSTIQVAALPLGCNVEIEVIARKG